MHRRPTVSYTTEEHRLTAYATQENTRDAQETNGLLCYRRKYILKGELHYEKIYLAHRYL